VSLTVKIATLNSPFKVSPAIVSLQVFLCAEEAASDDKPISPLEVLVKSEIMMAETEVPAGITLPVAGNSNKALADFILKSRLLI
jgi:hypothetical protein